MRWGSCSTTPSARPWAQDLILAQRVTGYRVGDLDRSFGPLGLEEGHLHVYGAMPSAVRSLLYPRLDSNDAPVVYVPVGLEADVLTEVTGRGVLHPRRRGGAALGGNHPAVNVWGGMSAATTKALESLHHHGLLRVSHRVNGTRVYEPARLGHRRRRSRRAGTAVRASPRPPAGARTGTHAARNRRLPPPLHQRHTEPPDIDRATPRVR